MFCLIVKITFHNNYFSLLNVIALELYSFVYSFRYARCTQIKLYIHYCICLWLQQERVQSTNAKPAMPKTTVQNVLIPMVWHLRIHVPVSIRLKRIIYRVFQIGKSRSGGSAIDWQAAATACQLIADRRRVQWAQHFCLFLTCTWQLVKSVFRNRFFFEWPMHPNSYCKLALYVFRLLLLIQPIDFEPIVPPV